MKPVIQQELTGCGIACAAAIAGITYTKAKQIANRMGIYANDPSLWSDPRHISILLNEMGIRTSENQKTFKNWQSLPDCALLSTKWHLEGGKPFWHWAVFVRDGIEKYVLDSKNGLKTNVRKDFGRIKPKWYIEVHI